MNRYSRLVWLLIMVGLAFVLPVTVFANVELVSFEASQADQWVQIDWETASEIDTSGFFVLRNTTGGTAPGDYAQIPLTDVNSGETDITFVLAEGDLVGAEYSFYDQNVFPGTYYYLLQAVNTDNTSEFFGPITITLTGGTPTPTNTPTSTPTITPSPTLSASPPVTASVTTTFTPSPTPTHTPTRTPTPTPTRTTTPVPTFPPFNTVTPTRTETPTPGPSPTFTLTPTITPSPSVTLHPLDLTLTAVLAQVSPLPTYTPPVPTRTPFPTWTPTDSPTEVPVTPGLFEGASASGLLGLFFSVLLFIAGGFMTFFLAFARKK